MKRSLVAPLIIVLLGQTPTWGLPDELLTTAHKSEYRQTGRYEEVPRLCQAFAQNWQDKVRIETFGTTPEGRPMLAMVVSSSGALTPEQAQAEGLPVMLFQGGIHAGEIDGKDAGFWALAELLERNDPTLKKGVFVFVPVFNVDGHERFGAWNRPNQTGPEEMGWRVTSANLNLNRDYAKAESPEMRAMLGLLNRWDPILYVDLHATNGAQFQPDIALMVEPRYVGDEDLQAMTAEMQKETMEALSAQGSMPLDFYPSFRTYSDPASGFADGAYPPRFSTGYWALRNRMTMLVETHSWKPYPQRVKVTKAVIDKLVELTARDGKSWLQRAARADQAASRLAGEPVTVKYRTAQKTATPLKFPGYAYRWEDSEISGGKALVYDLSTPAVWQVPFFSDVEPEVSLPAPAQGYLIPVTYAEEMGRRLKEHGISWQRIEGPLSERPLGAFRATEVKLSPRTLEGKTQAAIRGEWRQEQQSLAPGALFVPIAQPKARLVMALLEPQAPDSYAAWGYFNASFEQKEYMEEYVVEQVARQMLKEDPNLRSEFQQRLKTDPAFANSPEARQNFFYQRHPSYDARMNLYPILRLEEPL